MSRVEVSENIGPHQLKCIDAETGSGLTKYGAAFYSSNFTVHSYQVIISSIQSNTNLTFEIECTNDDGGQEFDHKEDATSWQTIATYSITNLTNSNGIMYSDVWNFKYSRCKISGDIPSAAVSVIEKHNA